MVNDKNILLIGDGGTNKCLNQITYFDNYLHASNNFNDSKVLRSYKILYDLGISNLYILNIRDVNSYISSIDLLKQLDFNYIVPVDAMISDKYFDTVTNSYLYLVNYVTEKMYGFNESIVIGTDKNASLYEDIDNFIEDMAAIELSVKNSIGIKEHGENLLFVANNLVNYELANVVLAASLALTEIDTYPIMTSIGDAIFDIDSTDIGNNSMIYFRGHDDRVTTIENLLNMRVKVSPEKIVTINRILKYIKRDMDFSEYSGKLYSDYQKLQVKKKLTKYLDKYNGYVITSYVINSVEFYLTDINTGTIVNNFDIVPISSFEKCTMAVNG